MSSISIPDLLVLVAYFVVILGTGLWSGRGERNTHDFFLGGRRQHWLLVGMSILATEVSAMTFLIVPGSAFVENWWYLQMYAGAFAGKILIAYFLLPAFYGSEVTTVYEYLGRRFGPATRCTASLMFFASRLLGSGIRLLAASYAIAIIFNCPLVWVVLLGASVAVLYATFGGIKSIIYTDAIQALVLIGGGIAVVVFLFLQVPGSWTENLAATADAGKLAVWQWGSNPNDDRLFWVLAIHATVQTMAAMGVDQDLTQRMLTCPDLKRGQRSLLFNAVIGFPIPCMFLLIGSLLVLYVQSQDGPAASALAESAQDDVFAVFIHRCIPSDFGLKGFLVAGVFAAAMSSLDSALGALSSSAVTDFYKPYVKREASQIHYLRMARVFTVIFGVILAGVALLFTGSHDLLESAFSFASLVFGGMLGVFVLGVSTKTRGSDFGNVAAMVSSVILLAAIKLLQDPEDPFIAWPWWVVLGAVWTWVVASCMRTSAPTQKAHGLARGAGK